MSSCWTWAIRYLYVCRMLKITDINMLSYPVIKAEELGHHALPRMSHSREGLESKDISQLGQFLH